MWNYNIPLVECLSDVRNINPFVLYYEIIENNHINHILYSYQKILHLGKFKHFTCHADYIDTFITSKGNWIYFYLNYYANIAVKSWNAIFFPVNNDYRYKTIQVKAKWNDCIIILFLTFIHNIIIRNIQTIIY